jgi:putative heme-binding domain-containing protein
MPARIDADNPWRTALAILHAFIKVARMKYAVFASTVCTFSLAYLLVLAPVGQAALPERVEWIWSAEGKAGEQSAAEARFFRRTFRVQRIVDEATLDITADSAFKVWINGKEVGSGKNWKRVYAFDVKKFLVSGKNVIGVEAAGTKGNGGLLVRFTWVPNGISREVIPSNRAWKSSQVGKPGWQTSDFDDSQWKPVKVLGPYGSTPSWQGLVWDSGGDDRFSVPEGFVVEMVAKNPDPKDPFSLINLTFDDRGRLLVSQENGPILLCSKPDKNGIFQSVKPYCSKVKSSQGMCWVDGALLLVGAGPNGPGLYRVSETPSHDQANKPELLLPYKGGMGEHGPHAILHGPDNWLYVVNGNHSWAKPEKLAANSPLLRWPKGQMGPDQGKPGTTEDVLLPRLNDANGHAADILAPGGAIWRLDRHGKNASLVTAGFRNEFDAAFSTDAELFTFDSDMEWDLELPWYRAVRVCHCPPGADFVWRTGSANTPDYYIDSLPPLLETGRGSPVGLEFYDHVVFPEKYRGAYFMADWSLGVIYALHLDRAGASYKGKAERFCQGNPMNVTDIAVGPDGALYFTMGGRHSQGGVYRIAYKSQTRPAPKGDEPASKVLAEPQPLAAWSRARVARELAGNDKAPGAKGAVFRGLADVAANGRADQRQRVRALTLLQNHGGPPDPDLLVRLAGDPDPAVRAHAIWLMGVNGGDKLANSLARALGDTDAWVRRRACEALIRAGIEPSVADIWPLLNDQDRFVRTAARLVLQRVAPEKWVSRLWEEADSHIVLEGINALCKIDKASAYQVPIAAKMATLQPEPTLQGLLDYLRTVELAFVHLGPIDTASLGIIGKRAWDWFPQADWQANRELAILLCYLANHGALPGPVQTKVIPVFLSEKDRQQQIHYFYCLRVVKGGWTAEQKHALLVWFDSTKTWQGGHSFRGFLENILRDISDIFDATDRLAIVTRANEFPHAALVMLKTASGPQIPKPGILLETFNRLAHGPEVAKFRDVRAAVVDAVGKSTDAEAPAILRKLCDQNPDLADTVARSLARFPTNENWPYLLKGLNSSSPLTLFDVIDGLIRDPQRPKADEPAPFRALLSASRHLDEKNRWKAVELLRHWTDNKKFGADDGDWKPELEAWTRWFGQSFPKEPPLSDVTVSAAGDSRYKFDELLNYLSKDSAGAHGDASRGRAIFEKAQCIKCHKFGKAGEGLGPDLSTVSKRFKRVDILDSIYYPSKVISDQYRSTTVVTKKGQQLTGLAAPQGDNVTMLLSDGTKVTLKKDEIDQQFASLISVMPEKLLDTLSKQEIADLFAFLESEPN